MIQKIKSFIKQNWLKILSFLLLAITSYGWYSSAKIVNHISLPTFSYTDLTEYGFDYVTIRGTIAKDESSDSGVANLLNTNEFICDKEVGKCTLVQAELFDDFLLSTYTESFPIKSWDENFIVFTTEPDAGQCVIWTYRIDRIKKELVGIREKRIDANSELCSIIGNDKFIIKVVDGLDLILKLKGY